MLSSNLLDIFDGGGNESRFDDELIDFGVKGRSYVNHELHDPCEIFIVIELVNVEVVDATHDGINHINLPNDRIHTRTTVVSELYQGVEYFVFVFNRDMGLLQSITEVGLQL